MGVSLLEQVILGGYYDLLHDTDTEYNSLVGGYLWSATESDRHKIVSTLGNFKGLRVKLNGSPGAGKHYDFTLMVNGAPSVLTLEIADADTGGSDMVNIITIAAGDRVSLQCNPDSTPTARYASWTIVFEGGNPRESLILGGTSDPLNSGANEYAHIMGAYDGLIGVENGARQVIPTAGTIKNLFVLLSEDPGNAPDAYKFTLRKGGASQTLTVTITANDVSGSDLVNSVAVVAGDIVTMRIQPLNGPASTPTVAWGMTFEADVDGESIILGGSWDDLSNAATEYNSIIPRMFLSWTANENERYSLGQACILKKLYILLSGPPGAGTKYDFTIRMAGADSTLTASVKNTDTAGNSGSLEDDVGADDYVTLKSVPDTAPNVGDAYWGFVCYLAPPVPVEVGPFICCPFCHDASTHVCRVGPAGVRGVDDSRRFFCEACGVFFSSEGETFWEAHGRLE